MATNSTDLGQSKYDFRYLTFPEDLGSDYVGHYMVININVPTKGFSLTAPNTNDPAGQFTNQFTTLNGDQRRFSKVDTLRYADSGLSGGNRTIFSIPRQTRRIAESIALFMPQGLAFTDQNEYQDIDMSAFGGTAGTAGMSAVGGLVGGVPGAIVAGVIADTAGNIINTLAPVMGSPINPGVEVIFSTKRLRVFTLDFLMAPRNEKESLNLKSIIKTLRFHMAPEVNSSTYGATWIPPADFDITFFKHGAENLHIQRMNTCVLNRIDVDYQPTGVYSTFTNGHPVSVRMTLHLQEVEPIHKLRILQGF